MKLPEIAELIKLLKESGVSRFKSDGIELRFKKETKETPKILTPEESASIHVPPPVEVEIAHHIDEVKGLLKLSDEELVDKMFPDFTEGNLNAN